MFTLANTDSAGNGSTERETLSYRADGVYLVAIGLATNKPAPYSLTLAPVGGPVRVIGTGATNGSKTFQVAGDGASATITFTVLGTTTATVGGKSYPALHITLNSSDLVGTVDGVKYTGSFSVDALFPADSGVPYRQQSSSAIKSILFSVSSDTTATLTSTTPS